MVKVERWPLAVIFVLGSAENEMEAGSILIVQFQYSAWRVDQSIQVGYTTKNELRANN